MYIITSGLNPHDDHIEHYGRKGMRWGEHIFGVRHINKLRKKIGKHVASAKNNKTSSATTQQLQLQQQMLHQQMLHQQLIQQLIHQQVHQQMMETHMHTQMQQEMTALGAHYTAMSMM